MERPQLEYECVKRFDSRPGFARASSFEYVLGSTMTVSTFLGEDSSSLLQPNAVQFESMGFNLRFDVDKIKVAVSHASVQSEVASLIPVLHGVVTRMRM